MSKTQKQPPNTKTQWTLRKIVITALKVIGIIIGFCFLCILVIALVIFVRYKWSQTSQIHKFANAEQACGKKPVVVVEDVVYLFGGEYKYTAYLPSSDSYEFYKTIVKNPLGIFGYEDVDGYYCSLEQAKSSFAKDPRFEGQKLLVDPVQ